ncbi:MAG: hypothetical protein K2W96_11820 [Gemmataceae bacterium]|nr:hypothetical protein [Gemmataceae bacterium]
MAVNKPQTNLMPRLRFLLRVVGLGAALGALAYVAAAVPRNAEDFSALWQPPEKAWPLYAMAGLAGLALLVEVVAALGFAAARRSVAGGAAAVQVVLAVLLLVGVNWWAFENPQRYDWTREKEFTLPDDLREKLARLDRTSVTKVIVYQRHKTFGALSDKPDRFDYAAERKVVEKVRDLADLLREVGPQLQVEVLDVEEEGYDEKLRKLTEGDDDLRKALDAAPENSIFISGKGSVQQMSFNEFYQLDRTESMKGRGNLVLLGQGEEGRGVRPFVNRILALEQRRPRVGILVVHELLTSQGTEPELTLAGMRASLASHGFDTRDIVLKRGWDARRLEAAADTFEESKLDRLDLEILSLDEDIKENQADEKEQLKAQADLAAKPGEDEAKKLKELTERYGGLFLSGKVTAAGRALLLRRVEASLAITREEIEARKKERDAKLAERATLDPDRALEARRLTDVKAKLGYAVADCDLLVIPRLTRQQGSGRLVAAPRLHSLSSEQADALRTYVKAGKPVLACLGPSNEPPGLRMPPELGPPGPDDLERMLERLGFHLGKSTVLFNSDARAFAERRQDVFRQETKVDTPALDFKTEVSEADPRLGGEARIREHPLRGGLRVLANSVGGGFDLRYRFARPVYFDGEKGGTFLLTDKGWNETKPFPSPDYRPRFTPPRPDDPDASTLDARRRGPFSVGAAAEVALENDAAPARVAVIGQGEAFVGAKLDPARERLLLQTANWLLGRDQYLPSKEHPWSYPRRPEKPEEPGYSLWLWGGQAGLPLLAAFLGVVVLLYRRVR